MTRISYRRATPENWELTIRRMMSLNNVQIAPEVARRVIKSLSDSHGLAPEEARPIMFDAERRLIDFTYSGDKETHELCSRCHSIGRVLSERRTKDEWSGLIAMHRYYYPGIDGASGGFRRGGPGSPGSQGGAVGRGSGDSGAGRGRGDAPDTQQPMDKALNHLVGALPLASSEWNSWAAAMRAPRLAGRWALSGYEIGKGPAYGIVTIADRPDAPDSFTTDGRITYTRSGQTVTRRSRAIVYTGFQWRGRSADTPDDPGTWREVAFIERNLQEIKGRWFTGAHDETGIDVTLRRVSNDALVSGTDVSALRAATTAQRVRVYGVNLPDRPAPADIDFGQGIKVSRIVGGSPEVLTVEVDVAADARMGPRDISFGGSTRPSAFVVYGKMDGIKVIPQAGMARLGGVTMPARAEQFEARGVSNGPDGKPGTADDLDLGPVDALWSLEEYTATFKDDDVKYVGEIAPGRSLHAERRRAQSESSGQPQQRRRRLGRGRLRPARRGRVGQAAACARASPGDGAVVSGLEFTRGRAMKTRTARALLGLVAIAAFASTSVSGQRSSPPLTGGNGTLYILRATLDWSYQLLVAGERQALAQLSVFEGGFELDAAEAVLKLEGFEPEGSRGAAGRPQPAACSERGALRPAPVDPAVRRAPARTGGRGCPGTARPVLRALRRPGGQRPTPRIERARAGADAAGRAAEPGGRLSASDHHRGGPAGLGRLCRRPDGALPDRTGHPPGGARPGGGGGAVAVAGGTAPGAGGCSPRPCG